MTRLSFKNIIIKCQPIQSYHFLQDVFFSSMFSNTPLFYIHNLSFKITESFQKFISPLSPPSPSPFYHHSFTLLTNSRYCNHTFSKLKGVGPLIHWDSKMTEKWSDTRYDNTSCIKSRKQSSNKWSSGKNKCKKNKSLSYQLTM